MDRLASAEKLAYDAMVHHGLIDAGWLFKFDRAKNRLGQCNFTHKTISMSKHWVEVLPEAELKDTVLHEIAHALAGPAAKHGVLWRAKARELGAKPEACAAVKVEINEQPPLLGTCPSCNGSIKRWRMPNGPRWCSSHSGFKASNLIEWSREGVQVEHSIAYTMKLNRAIAHYGENWIK